MATATKPSYLGTLNRISLAESAAGVYLEAWAKVTPIPELAKALRFVAARETSHGEVFCRRVHELGFELQPSIDVVSAKRLSKYANPDVSDLEKVGPISREMSGDPFADLERQLSDGAFDPLTAKLIEWYIAEERDSICVLTEAYDCVREMAAAGSTSVNGTAGATGPRRDRVRTPRQSWPA
jgi:hypothetical protein